MTKREKYTFYTFAIIVVLLVCVLLGVVRFHHENNLNPYYSNIEVSLGTSNAPWINVSVFNGEMSGSGIVLIVRVQNTGIIITHKVLALYFVDGKWKLDLSTRKTFQDDFPPLPT